MREGAEGPTLDGAHRCPVELNPDFLCASPAPKQTSRPAAAFVMTYCKFENRPLIII